MKLHGNSQNSDPVSVEGGEDGGDVVIFSRDGNILQPNMGAKVNISIQNLDVDEDKGVEGGGGEGGGGDVDKCSRGGKVLRPNMGAKVNIDVEDEDVDEAEYSNGAEEDIDEILDQIDEGSHSSRPVQPMTGTILETQVLSTSTIHLLSTLAGSCRAVTSSTSTVFNNATNVLNSLVTGHSWDAIETAFQENTLLSIAQRCSLSEKLVESSQVILSLNLIQLRTKIES